MVDLDTDVTIHAGRRNILPFPDPEQPPPISRVQGHDTPATAPT
ncbi:MULTISPECIES: hypothetical protein [Novacetimonas]|nr:hypothetical protein [Novacetimonas hansenii]WEQ60182.1 hypothetical protein LV563_06730 [Novacetimonas hansenii]